MRAGTETKAASGDLEAEWKVLQAVTRKGLETALGKRNREWTIGSIIITRRSTGYWMNCINHILNGFNDEEQSVEV